MVSPSSLRPCGGVWESHTDLTRFSQRSRNRWVTPTWQRHTNHAIVHDAERHASVYNQILVAVYRRWTHSAMVGWLVGNQGPSDAHAGGVTVHGRPRATEGCIRIIEERSATIGSGAKHHGREMFIILTNRIGYWASKGWQLVPLAFSASWDGCGVERSAKCRVRSAERGASETPADDTDHRIRSREWGGVGGGAGVENPSTHPITTRLATRLSDLAPQIHYYHSALLCPLGRHDGVRARPSPHTAGSPLRIAGGPSFAGGRSCTHPHTRVYHVQNPSIDR
jgi:hypothetical protein